MRDGHLVSIISVYIQALITGEVPHTTLLCVTYCYCGGWIGYEYDISRRLCEHWGWFALENEEDNFSQFQEGAVTKRNGFVLSSVNDYDKERIVIKKCHVNLRCNSNHLSVKDTAIVPPRIITGHAWNIAVTRTLMVFSE